MYILQYISTPNSGFEICRSGTGKGSREWATKIATLTVIYMSSEPDDNFEEAEDEVSNL